MANPIQWHIGCSGFHYREWKDVFYPPKLPQRLWFDHYSKQFNSLELNSTFYQFPKAASLKKWQDQSPEHFRFSLKVPRIITHYKKLNDTAQLLDDFYGAVREGLGSKLGAVLFQLPPQFIYTPENLGLVTAAAQQGFPNVVEFRHNSWWTEVVYQQLASNNIAFCGISHPRLPDEVIANTRLLYYRFHGVPVLYKSEYAEMFLKKIADGILSGHAETVFVYFNNTMDTAALTNARWLMDYLRTPEHATHLTG